MVDPEVKEVQREIKIPVIAAGRAAAGLAITLSDRLARIFPNSVRVNELASRKKETLEELKIVSQRQIKTRGVDALVFNCAYLGGASNYMQDKVGVSVMATTEIALRTAETIALLGILPVQPEGEVSRVSNFNQAIYRIKDGFHHLNVVLK